MTLEISEGRATTISTPSVLGAVVLKAAAFRTDSRDPGRHLQDAAILLACLDNPLTARQQYTGSDLSRMHTLARNLPDDAPEWRLLGSRAADGQAALRLRVSPD